MRVEAFYHDERAWAVPAHLFDRRIRRTSKPDAAARCQCGRRRCSAPPRLRTQPPKKARRREGRGESREGAGPLLTMTQAASLEALYLCLQLEESSFDKNTMSRRAGGWWDRGIDG